jgi:hypothetical protein
MATVASLQIKIGADVSAAINGLSKAEFAATKVKEAYIEANDATVKGGFAIAGWAQNFSTAIGAVKRNLDSIDLSKLSKEQQDSTSNMLSLASGALRVTENITVASSAFSGMQAIAGPALAGIARLIPSIGASLAGLAGPIGIAVGVLAAGAALIVSNWDLVAKKVDNTAEIMASANRIIVEQKVKVEELTNTLKSDISTRQEKYNAIKKLNEISTTHFANLTAEKSSVEDINKAYNAYIENILKAATAQAASEKIVELSRKQLDIQLRYNKALLDASAATKLVNDAPKFNGPNFGVEQGVLDRTISGAKSIKTELDAVNKQIDDIASFKSKISFTESDGILSGGGGKNKDAITETEKIQSVIDSLGKKLEQIQAEFKAGIIPDDFAAQVDAVQGAISQIGSINPNSEAFRKLIEDYKSLANQNPVSIDIIPRVAAVKVDSLNELPDRVADVTEQMNASFSKINFAESFEAKAAAVTEAIKQKLKDAAETISEVAGIFSNVTSVISEFDNQSFASREATLDAYYAKQKDYIEKSVSDEGLKGKKLEALEKEVTAKKKAIKRDEAAANKRNAIFNSIINTAQGVSSALATGNIPLSILVGALGAAQTAAIASTPLPALQSGGLVRGRNTVVVGEYAGADNNPELISPVNKVKKYITEAVIESGGGGITQLVSYISGDDLVLISERGQYRKNRLG